MSTYPTQPGQPPKYAYEAPPTNGLGVAGFVVSLSGLIVCFGLICPIGLLLSLFALLNPPRGFAIAGTIIGFIGSILGVMAVLVFTTTIGNGAFFNWLTPSATSMTIYSASVDIENHFMNNNDTLPDEPTGNTIISGYVDEWNNNLEYKPVQGSTTDYTISSAGPDGVFGNGDDEIQYFTAINWSTTLQPQTQNEEVEDPEIDAAFNLAAKQIVDAFPPGTGLPTAEQVQQQADPLVDAWNTPMQYSPTDNPPWYHLKSAGPDQQWNTNDDIKRTFYFEPVGETDGPL
jgi:hypothetical protein